MNAKADQVGVPGAPHPRPSHEAELGQGWMGRGTGINAINESSAPTKYREAQSNGPYLNPGWLDLKDYAFPSPVGLARRHQGHRGQREVENGVCSGSLSRAQGMW